MKKHKKNIMVPDIEEFTDDEGKKWIQTSTDDLFSTRELNDVLESIEKDREAGEIVLARIDFQKVNKEYYETAVVLQKKLKKQTEILKKVINESNTIIDRKNQKLKELIEYIKKLHTFIAYINTSPESLEGMKVPIALAPQPEQPAVVEKEPESVYEEPEEKILPHDAEEKDMK